MKIVILSLGSLIAAIMLAGNALAEPEQEVSCARLKLSTGNLDYYASLVD